MNEINAMAHELRLMARLVRDYDYKEISRMLREAADTIECLRNQVVKCQIAELKADYDTSRYYELFGTPERAARTLELLHLEWSDWCAVFSECRDFMFGQVDDELVTCWEPDDFSLLEWLRSDAE